MGRRRPARHTGRQRNPSRDPFPPSRRVEVGADGYDYEVRPVTAARAAKIYRCPGCDHEIRLGIAHVVVWPADGTDGLDDRRHWHTACWNNRTNRGPTRRWS